MIHVGYSPKNEAMDRAMNLDGVLGYFVRFCYEGDSLSDYTLTVIVIADSESEAIKIARKYIPKEYDGARAFEIDRSWNNNLGGKSGTIPCIGTYLKKYPHANAPILDSKGFVRR